jgi:hypothetical protein
MKPAPFRLGRALAVIALIAGLFFGLRVPQSLSDLRQKHQAIRQMQKTNADLTKDLVEKRERVRRLRDDRTEQEFEIKKRLKLQREGETAIIVPEQPKN